MRSQKEWVVPQRHFRMPGKKVAKREQTEEEGLQYKQPEMERYQLQIDRQTKRSFKTAEAARSAALPCPAPPDRCANARRIPDRARRNVPYARRSRPGR